MGRSGGGVMLGLNRRSVSNLRMKSGSSVGCPSAPTPAARDNISSTEIFTNRLRWRDSTVDNHDASEPASRGVSESLVDQLTERAADPGIDKAVVETRSSPAANIGAGESD